MLTRSSYLSFRLLLLVTNTISHFIYLCVYSTFSSYTLRYRTCALRLQDSTAAAADDIRIHLATPELSSVIGGFEGPGGHAPNLAPNKFQERPCGAFSLECKKHLSGRGSAPDPIQAAYLQRFPCRPPITGGEGLAAPSHEPHPRSWPFWLRASALAPDPK